ncbi:hypothetical protein Glove_184g21 [Diversispora epigaea]|uniref:Uncharacterized protein n=1 Tax=Diversispora epigaea TaxID=1348612 RepID=A0A397IX08_9GLOM|nr:hypothetical protein Glove_184g21 [Diversispora epigaea]
MLLVLKNNLKFKNITTRILDDEFSFMKWKDYESEDVEYDIDEDERSCDSDKIIKDKLENRETSTNINSPEFALIPCVIIDYIQDTNSEMYKLRVLQNLHGK